MRINKIKILGSCLPSVLFISQCVDSRNSEKPNIVIIIADDLGWSDVGYNGAEFYETPNIDKLAQQGMILNRFYPSAANSAPSRACLLTGMYSPRHGVYLPQGLSRGGDVSKMRWKVPTHGQDESFNTFPVSINNVDPKFESLAEMLKRGGYISARFGKWHIGDDNQGFDVSSADGTPGFVTNLEGSEERFYSDISVAERLTDASIEFIRKNRRKPFFLYLSHWEVHGPMAAREDRIAYYEEKKKNYKGEFDYDPVYAAEVEQLDISAGRITEVLRQLKLEKNTLIIFTSDNGGTEKTTNYPLRSRKGTFYEGGIRVPFCIRWPGVITPGTESDSPVSGIDFMPTFAEIASVDPPSSQPVDGISFLPLLKGLPYDYDRQMFFHFPLYLGGDPLPTYKGEENYWRAVPSTTLIEGDWKLIFYYEYDRYELFNLRDDISESNDLSLTQPEIALAMVEKISAWTKEVNAPVPSVLNK